MNIIYTWLIVVALVGVSALCSGLNVSLMSLNLADLKRKAKLGNIDAKRVLPLRRNTHLTLGAILFTNVAAVSASSLVLESILYGVVAGIVSTLLMVVFGELLPQAFLARRALYFMSKFSPFVRFMIIVTYPVSKLLQLMLDKVLSAETTPLHSRQELGIIITEHLGTTESELDEDEVEIIRGALQLSEKRVRDITTPIAATYWLTPTTRIDTRQIDEIKKAGRSRIPILNKAHTICFGVLLVKDMVDIDFENDPPLAGDLALHPTETVGSMTALDTMFRKFIASGTHLLPVEKDDKIIGIVTIEDLIEEIVGHEIFDETDRSLKRS